MFGSDVLCSRWGKETARRLQEFKAAWPQFWTQGSVKPAGLEAWSLRSEVINTFVAERDKDHMAKKGGRGGEQQCLGGWTWDRFLHLAHHLGSFLLAILQCTRRKHTTFIRGVSCFKHSLLPAHQYLHSTYWSQNRALKETVGDFLMCSQSHLSHGPAAQVGSMNW